ncbi:Ionotropic receptor 60a [Carabus blaptoides fortunei]
MDLFPTKVPLYANGCELRLLPLEVPPYVINATDHVNPGLEVTIARELGKRINFTVKVVQHSFRETGYKYSADGSFTGLYHMLHSRKGDLIFGMLRQNTSYVNDFDSTFVHLTDQVTWHVATANVIREWKNLAMIFTWKLWFILFLFIFINAFSWWFVGRRTRDLRNYTEIRRTLLTGYYILLGGSTSPPRTGLLRLLFLLWTLCSILLVAAYQCKLISLLTKNIYGYQIATEQEFIKQKIQFGYFPGFRNIFKEYANQTGYNLYNNYNPCPIVGNECIIRAAYQRDFVVVKNRRQIRYLTERLLLFPNGRHRLYSMEKNIFIYLLRMMTHRGYPFLHRINYLLLYMQQNGLIEKWDKEVAPRYKYQEKTGAKKLRLNHLQGVFMLIIIGLSLAVTVFVLELCLHSRLGDRNIIHLFQNHSP